MLQQVNTPQSIRCMSEKNSLNALVYNALRREDEETVIKLCEDFEEHGLHILTIHDDTVLQAATYAKKPSLVLRLLQDLPDRHLDKLTRQNLAGNSILHEAAISNIAIEVAKSVLEKAPGLLCMRNNLGETALFRTARYGKQGMYDFLAKKISGYDEASQKVFLQRRDKTTILHMAILSENFVYLYYNPVKQESTKTQAEIYKSALQLAEFLIEGDSSWETTYPGTDQSKPVLHKYGSGHTTEKKVGEGTAMSSLGLEEGAAKTQEGATKTPLFLATRSGCFEIVEKILKLYPQAVEHIDERGRNILHIAIKYRQLNIFELVKNMELPMRRLTRKIDEDGNSILHTVGKKSDDYVPEKMQGPALELQDELRWFERVKSVTPPHFLHHRNNQKLTAEGLFDETNKELREKGKEWIKRTAEGCSVVAVLIATVAFAAAYTIPGGSNDMTGIPLFLNQPFFVVFTVADVLSISFALTSVVVFLAIIASPFRFADFRHSLPNKLTFGLTLLFLSVSMMMLSFAATVLLMIKNGEGWTKVLLYAMSFMPVGLFALSYFPLYLALSKSYKYLLNKAWQVISQSPLSRGTKTFHQTSNSPYPQYTVSV
ncbi:ankyrin repeat-containing protein ITN1-like isoform X2 [Quercus robur]|uniref:ankyrin repeat-containing protein ITN1-like isoform X2 n=1 Tax=Quercus robur TaxID=38942 RepID=UPI002162D022|nr:ankyrin repeat-containing protein ITN1-like isoform X2 [Quercus robur]